MLSPCPSTWDVELPLPQLDKIAAAVNRIGMDFMGLSFVSCCVCRGVILHGHVPVESDIAPGMPQRQDDLL